MWARTAAAPAARSAAVWLWKTIASSCMDAIASRSWAPQAATILAAFALSFAMPVGTVLTLALLGATAAGVGIAAQRRHGGEGMPALPHALED